MSWRKVKLGNICTIEKGMTGIQKAIPGPYPMVVTSEERKSHNEYQFDAEAVIVPLVSSTGHGHASLKRIHYQTGKFALGSILCAIIPNDSTVLNAEYLYRFLDSNKENELVGRMKGMANVSLPLKEIAQIEIPLPPTIEEQLKFVESYKQLENQSSELSTELTHQLDLVKQLRQSFLREAMQGKLVESSHDGETGQQLLAKIKAEKAQLIAAKKLKKEKELPPIKAEEIPFEIPEHWTWCRLGEVSEEIVYGTSEKAFEEGEIPVLRMGNITTDGKILYSNLKYVSSTIPALPKLYLNNGDMVFNRTNSFELVGKTGVFENDKPYTLASYLIRVRFMMDINSRFISNYINSSLCRLTQLEPQIIQQNGQANFNGTKLGNIIIPLPPLSEQRRIVEKLESLMQTCDALEASIKSSQLQNQQLLQQVLREALKK
ncbi:restriction endonuclease subunit S [Runella salmonicolor]|uniref:Restriction endonuclease subunit S n=1 Tax=Runella salmonicolor TaxID=2950278 RepID=A0ABT1FN47_9BACT|nr:restriction endonuclease subunit S [Runella salmonicolor]MCP1381947.1 restriction endonuclease subunit S [Runella salmonicolor]